MFFKNKTQAQREKILSYKQFFTTDNGKIVLYDLMNKYHILNPHKGDDAFAEGQRSVVLGILSQCNISIEEFDKLTKGE